MKKLVCLLTVVLMVMALSTFAFAEEKTVLTVETVEAAAGAEVKVYISIVNNPGIVLGEGTVSFDTTALEMVSMEWVGQEDWAWSYREMNVETGYFLFFADAKADYKLQGDCALLCLTLKVKEDVLPGTYNVEVFVNDIGDDAVSLIAEETFTGAVVVPCNDHDMEVVSETPATCTEAGERVLKCKYCEYTETETIDALGHTWGEWEVTTPATCAAAGTETRTCSVCGETETREIPAAEGHTWNEGEVTTEATCCTEGVKTYTCTVCGEAKTESIAATGEHKVAYKDNLDGKTHTVYCENSGKELDPAEAHKFVDGVCICGAVEVVPPTGDNSVIAVVMATLSMMSIAVVASKKKEF